MFKWITAISNTKYAESLLQNLNEEGRQMADMEFIHSKAKLLVAEIEMNGMIAENKQREALGQSMAYTEQDFLNIIKEYGILELTE